MLVEREDGTVEHYPMNRDAFAFDAEVAAVFPDMAHRSIPLYKEAHDLHASLVKQQYLDRFTRGDTLSVYDVGSSRGEFFRSLCTQMQIDPEEGHHLFNFWAIDSSSAMLGWLALDMPWVRTLCGSAEGLGDFINPADVVCMNYLLQFVKSRADRLAILRWAYRNLEPGGLLLLGQKNAVSDSFSDTFAGRYNQFRLDNGYSQKEIDTKTAALKNSMWPISPVEMENLCYDAGFIDYAETTRWLQFSTSICVRG